MGIPYISSYKDKEWEKMIKEYYFTDPLWVTLRTTGIPKEKVIKRAIHGEKAKQMSIRDVIKYCLNGPLTTDESIMANNIRAILNDRPLVIINEKSNPSLDYPILKFAIKDQENLTDGRILNYRKADIEVRRLEEGGILINSYTFRV